MDWIKMESWPKFGSLDPHIRLVVILLVLKYTNECTWEVEEGLNWFLVLRVRAKIVQKANWELWRGLLSHSCHSPANIIIKKKKKKVTSQKKHQGTLPLKS